MNVQVRYFASVREALGAGDAVQLGAGSDVAALRAALVARGGSHAEALAPGRALRSARNRVLCAESTALEDGDEVAFFPPVTGG